MNISQPIAVAELISTFKVGGAEVLALELARRFDRTKFRPIAYALRVTGEMEARFNEAGIETRVIGGREGHGLDIRAIWRMAKQFRKDGVQVLHCHNRPSHIYGAFAGRLARLPVIVCTRHSAPVNSTENGRAVPLERIAIPLTHWFTAVSENVYRTAVETKRLPAKRCTVIPNGVDLARFGAGNPEPETDIVIVARLSPEKRHDLLLEAMRRLAERGLRPTLSIAGDGPTRSSIEGRIHEFGLAGQVRMLGMRKDIPEVLRSARVFALVSDNEGQPITIIEAMAAGLPVIATEVGGVPEVVSDGRTGLLVPPNDPERLARALEQLLKSPEMRKTMGEEGKRVAHERFDIRESVKKYEGLFTQLLTEKGVVSSFGGGD